MEASARVNPHPHRSSPVAGVQRGSQPPLAGGMGGPPSYASPPPLPEGEGERGGEGHPFPTLPDYLWPALEIVFVGINPGAYSARVGHYFATPTNRFWQAINRSRLVSTNRKLGPADDAQMHDYGIGFTDVVKRASRSASDLRAEDYRTWAPVLKEKLLRYQPVIVCFNGLTALRNYLLYAEGVKEKLVLGPQERRIGTSHVFVVPSPSPANAAFSLETLTYWYGQLGRLRDQVRQEKA